MSNYIVMDARGGHSRHTDLSSSRVVIKLSDLKESQLADNLTQSGGLKVRWSRGELYPSVCPSVSQFGSTRLAGTQSTTLWLRYQAPRDEKFFSSIPLSLTG